jgi:hypothetical protein
MTAEDVDLAIIKPMCRLYKPTGHLQATEGAPEEALKEYRRALAVFDQDVLERAWQNIVRQHRFWCWPSVAEIVQAADQAHRELHPPGRIDEMAEEAEAMSWGYTKRFMKTSTVAARAREGGYEAQLKRYVRAVSRVQAQIVKRHLVFPVDVRNPRQDNVASLDCHLWPGSKQGDRSTR